MFLICSALNVNAAITSKYDLQNTVNKLDNLANFDCLSLINRNELIGNRLNGFIMRTSEYQRMVITTKDSIIEGLSRIDFIENSGDYSDSEKAMQLREVYNNANYALSDLNSKTINYIMSMANYMPSLTYQKYIVKFQNYYNSLNLTDNDLLIK